MSRRPDGGRMGLLQTVGGNDALERKQLEEHIKDLRCASSGLSERRLAVVAELSHQTRNQGWAPLLGALARVSAEPDKTSQEYISTKLESQDKLIEELKKQYLSLTRGISELNGGLVSTDDKVDAIMDLVFRHGEAISSDRSHRVKSERENDERVETLKRKCKDNFLRLSDYEVRLATTKAESTSRSDNLAASFTSIKAEFRGARNDMKAVQEANPADPEVAHETEFRLNTLEIKYKEVVQQISKYGGQISSVKAESAARTHSNTAAIDSFRAELRKIHLDMELHVAEKCARLRDEVENGAFGVEVTAKADEAEEVERMWREDAMKEFESRSQAALSESVEAGKAAHAEAIAFFERRTCAAEQRNDERAEVIEEQLSATMATAQSLQAEHRRLVVQARGWENPVSTLRANVDELMRRQVGPEDLESSAAPKARGRRHHASLGASRTVRTIARGFTKGPPSGHEPVVQRSVTSPFGGAKGAENGSIATAHRPSSAASNVHRPSSSRSTTSNVRPPGQESPAAEAAVRAADESPGDGELDSTQRRKAGSVSYEFEGATPPVTPRRPFSAASHGHTRPHTHVLGR